MTIKLRWMHIGRGDMHTRVTVFVGPDKDHLANCGDLTFRLNEAKCFRESLRHGADNTDVDGFSVFLESGWEAG